MAFKKIAALATAAAVTIVPLGACAADAGAHLDDGELWEEELPAEGVENLPELELPAEEEETEAAESPAEEEEVQPETPAVTRVRYVMVTGEGVNIRSGAGTGYSSLGSAEKDTLYALISESDGWYKTSYRNKTAYISAQYCKEVSFESGSEKVEAVIAVGTTLLGIPYVYGAVRLHDGKGNLCSGFSVGAFDCSSLTQYMFYYGANVLLQVNTRTQIYQGTTVSRSELKRGDLMFFTNASRYYNTGIERVGHVAVYLGDNYILHTSSDYAKIEKMTAQRWNYYIQAQRIV